MSKNIKIGMAVNLLPDDLHHGGVSHQLHEFAQHLSQKFDITIFSINKTNLKIEYVNKSINIPQIFNKNKFTSIILFPLFVRFQDLERFDILHTHGDDCYFFFVKKPIIRTFYGSAFGEFRTATSIQRKIHQFIRYFTEFISGYHAKINVSISSSTKKYLPFIDRVIPCGIDLKKYTPGREKSKNPSILFVGTIRGRKRGSFLLDVFTREIRPVIPNAELWVVSSEEVTGEGIKWFGRIPEDELIKKYQSAWVFCLPSTYEGFGVPYIEAMACGTTAIATPNPGANEVLCNGKYGPIVDDKILGKTIINLLRNKKLRNKYVRKGLEYVTRYSWENVIKDYEKLYSRLLNRKIA